MDDDKVEEYRETKRVKRIRDANELDRPGYWQCSFCTAHNLSHRNTCGVCGRDSTRRKDD
jgi:hypothetical protein